MQTLSRMETARPYRVRRIEPPSHVDKTQHLTLKKSCILDGKEIKR